MESYIAQAFREWTEFGILIFATGFGIYKFIYKNIYVPAQGTATLTVRRLGWPRLPHLQSLPESETP